MITKTEEIVSVTLSANGLVEVGKVFIFTEDGVEVARSYVQDVYAPDVERPPEVIAFINKVTTG